MSRLRRDMFQRKLNSALAKADDESFFVMAWATQALQSKREENAKPYLEYPPEAVTTELGSPYSVHPWRLETLLNEVLAIPKLPVLQNHPNRRLNCRSFAAVRTVSNYLFELESAHDGITLRHLDVMKELHRLGQRTFEWQFGFISYPQFYRSAFLHSGELTRDFFLKRYGLSIPDFTLGCFILNAHFLGGPKLKRKFTLKIPGVSAEILKSTLNIISISHKEARLLAIKLRAGHEHISYKRSIFREFPCIVFDSDDEHFCAPLADLISLRGTSGIFYDVVKAGQNIRNEISSRFEKYCSELIQLMLPSHIVRGSYKYFFKKDEIESPDILLTQDEAISVILECKATRMTYEARFSENPVESAPRGYDEIAKGVAQIWRFASHIRRGILPNEKLKTGTVGIVLTLDTWLAMASPMRAEVIAKAKNIIKKDSDILIEDQIPILFCPIADLERTLRKAGDTSFVSSVYAAATEEQYNGWMLSGVADKVTPSSITITPYPFEEKIADYLPWWNKIRPPAIS